MINLPLSEAVFTVVDTETTGFSPKYSKLVEIAAVKIMPGLRIDGENLFSHLINPLCSIGYDSYRIHGISDAMVSDKPHAGEIMPLFTRFAENTVLVAHNAKFDMGFIEAAMREYGVTPSHIGVIDTVSLARKAFPGYRSYSLDSMIKNLGLKVPISDSYRHRALFDAAHTAGLLIKCINSLKTENVLDFFDL